MKKENKLALYRSLYILSNDMLVHWNLKITSTIPFYYYSDSVSVQKIADSCNFNVHFLIVEMTFYVLNGTLVMH